MFGVIQGRSRRSALLCEADTLPVRIDGPFVMEDLDGDDSAASRVFPRAIHPVHPAGAEWADDFRRDQYGKVIPATSKPVAVLCSENDRGLCQL
jgi:hypothetical protein